MVVGNHKKKLVYLKTSLLEFLSKIENAEDLTQIYF